MKKVILFFLALTGVLAVQAKTDFPYLTFEMTDGTKVSVDVTSLTLTVSGTTLTAGEQSFTLTNLNKMYFSPGDETTTGISEVMTADLNEATAIYDLNGRRVNVDVNGNVNKGVYIIKTKQGTFKVNVK
jgi:hypothetical protein